MNTLEILGYFKKITLCLPHAQYNVVPCDKLIDIEIKSYPFLVCVNKDDSSKGGSHWIGLYIARRGGELECIDSYGISVFNYSTFFLEFVKKNNLRVIESNVMLQGPTSEVCGHYVIMYMYKRLQSCSRHAFYSMFTNNLDKNDKKVSQLVNKIFISKFKTCKYFQTCKSIKNL